jgi:hypothetical protein
MSTRRVTVIAAALMTAAIALRGVLAFGGYFYWDDLILVGRAGTQNVLSWRYLFDDHDGHVMPGAFLTAGIITRLAPLEWFWPAASLVALQLLAWLALLRTLHIMLGWRPALLVPLTFALFTPLGVPGFAWWAAALNSLPMLAALAWVCGDAILLVRTGNQRYAGTGLLVFVGGLLFFEKSAVIPFVAFTVTALLSYVAGERDWVRSVWRRGVGLWVSSLAVLAAWIVVYVVVVDQQRWSWDLAMTWDLLRRSVTHGIVPGLVGGPWTWQRWAPASPWAVPPTTVMVLGWATLATVVAVSLARKQRLWPVWAVALGYAVACQIPIYLMRSSRFTALELAQTLRYLPDLVFVLALLSGIGLCAPNRVSPRLEASRVRTAALAVLSAMFVTSSVYSTSAFMASWRDNPTKAYLQSAQASLGAARNASRAALLDQEVDPLILQRMAWPENLVSHMFALVKDRPEFAASTTELRMLDMSGRLVDAKVTWVRITRPGPIPQCGYLTQPDAPVTMPLDGPLLPSEWIAELNYLANTDGSMTLALSEGPATRVPVHPGLNRVYVRLSGAGDAITVRGQTAALSVCLASGPVGNLAPM